VRVSPGLLDKMLDISGNMYDIPTSWIARISELKRELNGTLDEHSNEKEVEQTLAELRTFIDSVQLDKEQKDVLQDIIKRLQIAVHKFVVNMMLTPFHSFHFFLLAE